MREGVVISREGRVVFLFGRVVVPPGRAVVEPGRVAFCILPPILVMWLLLVLIVILEAGRVVMGR